MGYDIHITRKENWSDDEGNVITRDEWLRTIESDPELKSVERVDDDAIACEWNGRPLFWFEAGEITCKNPNEATILKMVQIAHRLNANVQGDDGEHYPESLPASKTSRDSIWKRLFDLNR